eukprot:CAMPEP_0176498136 /NCGR_PEP_ID=MMETSP0200_2-20121128/12139_1 /TAXON_ID=947934 /ORGANISM="Chaetoceros sp., Strain GSL56" /LENGTH=870 /DNA_ID=CAMNT_0017896281 /DNA_START=269 /DNA_END=2881 /DNA_ORIENTATION=-
MSPHSHTLHSSPRLMRKSASVFGSHSRFFHGGGGSGSYGFNSRLGSNATLASIDDTCNDHDLDDDDDDDDAGDGDLGSCSYSCSPSSERTMQEQNLFGPDAAAGLGDGGYQKHHWGAGTGEDTPPGLVALSPVPLDEYEDEVEEGGSTSSNVLLEDSPSLLYDCGYDDYKYNVMRRRRAKIHMKRIQDKLKDEVFRHPQSIRSYCLSSQRVAAKMREKRSKFYSTTTVATPTTCSHCHEMMRMQSEKGHHVCHHNRYKRPLSFHHQNIFQFLVSSVLDNVPLSILLDVSCQTFQVSFQVTHASVSLTTATAEIFISALAHAIHGAFMIVSENLNPLILLRNILYFQQKAMGMTGEVIVTGIQSVATGVGSAYHPMSRRSHTVFGSKTLSPKGGMVSVGQSLVGGLLRTNASGGGGVVGIGIGGGGGNLRDGVLSDKVYRKLNKINPAAKVITYIERDDEVLTRHAKKRVQRMMHYNVPLRPFIATVEVTPVNQESNHTSTLTKQQTLTPFENIDFVSDRGYEGLTMMRGSTQSFEMNSGSEHGGDENDSPFMCSPKSFPPTPSSRAHVLARGTKFAEDIVFLARDQLRVEEGLGSENEQTRAMAKALREGKRLAVFNASDIGSGIHLSCGQHCASKFGNDLYSSARGMIPILRNSFVYFEMSVSTPPLLSMVLHHASLSIGLSTLEMPLNALVGAWKGSVGLCSTGQILAGSQWCSPLNPKTYGSNCTIGCLVYLDDDSAFETWDGLMVVANVVFNVDGHIILPRASSRTEDIDERLSPVLPIFVPRDEELFPTLTLHSSQTEVMCRFCSEDIIAKSRAEIGAPNGAVVFAIDGSVLFDGSICFGSMESNDDISYSQESDIESHDDGDVR